MNNFYFIEKIKSNFLCLICIPFCRLNSNYLFIHLDFCYKRLHNFLSQLNYFIISYSCAKSRQKEPLTDILIQLIEPFIRFIFIKLKGCK